MAITRTLKLEKLTPTVGAEVLGVDVERLRDDDAVPDALMSALEANGVLVFKRLCIDDETQVEVCRRLGEIALHPDQPNPAVFIVTLDPNKNHMADSLKSTVGWHIDGTSTSVPPKATMLSAKALSTTGGETEFASTHAAYESLSEEQKARFAELRIWHRQEASQRSGQADPTPEQLAEWRKRSREQPLVWTHGDGRKSLVIGHSADHVIGMDHDEGHALLRELDAQATAPDLVYRHHWSEGDTVIWDNRGVLHRATPYDPGSRREMHRTTLVGDEPIR